MSADINPDAGAREPLPDDREELVANLAALRLFAIYAQTPLIWALVERRAVDLERILAFNRMIADLFRPLAATTTQGRVAERSHALVSEMLNELEATVRNMGTKPPGAGHA